MKLLPIMERISRIIRLIQMVMLTKYIKYKLIVGAGDGKRKIDKMEWDKGTKSFHLTQIFMVDLNCNCFENFHVYSLWMNEN